MNRALNKKEFNDIVSAFNWTDDNKLAAEKVLVDRLSVAEVAEHFKKSRQRINHLTKQVWEAYIEKSGIPGDWEVVTVPLPRPEAKKIKELSVKLREGLIAKAMLEKK